MGGISHQMAGIRECGKGQRGDEMEFLEIVSVFPGWDYRLFHGTSDAGFRHGGVFLHCGFFDDYFYHCAQDDIRGSGIGLAVSGMHYIDDQRSAVFLHGYFGAISRKDIYGSEKAADISGEGAVLTVFREHAVFKPFPWN